MKCAGSLQAKKKKKQSIYGDRSKCIPIECDMDGG